MPSEPRARSGLFCTWGVVKMKNKNLLPPEKKKTAIVSCHRGEKDTCVTLVIACALPQLHYQEYLYHDLVSTSHRKIERLWIERVPK